MNRYVHSLLNATLLLCICNVAFAVEGSLDATTVVRFEQRDTGASSKKLNLVPATQFIGMDSDKMADGNLSLHLYGWGRAALSDTDYNDTTNTAGSLTYGYAQYRWKYANADLRVGRLTVRDGIYNEYVDGVGGHTDLPAGFGVSLFGGAPVHTAHLTNENSDGKGDSIAGGRLSWRHGASLELGASTVYEGQSQPLKYHTLPNHRIIGADLWYLPLQNVEIIGHSSFNTDTGRFAEHSYRPTIKPTKELSITGEYEDYDDRSLLGPLYSFITTSSYNATTAGLTSRFFGALVSYDVNDRVTTTADYRHYSRSQGGGDRFGANVSAGLLDKKLRGGLSYHYFSDDGGFAITSLRNGSFHQLNLYLLHEAKKYSSSLDFSGYFLRESLYNENNIWETTATFGYQIAPQLTVTAAVAYGRDTTFTEDLRGLLKLVWNTNYSGEGSRK